MLKPFGCEARIDTRFPYPISDDGAAPRQIGLSAYGPKRTWLVALHMSAFGGKADFVSEKANIRKISAFDPKRTWAAARKLRKSGLVNQNLGLNS
jgi:hypothetical protein